MPCPLQAYMVNLGEKISSLDMFTSRPTQSTIYGYVGPRNGSRGPRGPPFLSSPGARNDLPGAPADASCPRHGERGGRVCLPLPPRLKGGGIGISGPVPTLSSKCKPADLLG